MTPLPTKEEIAKVGQLAWHELVEAQKQGEERAILRHNQGWQYLNDLLRDGKYRHD